MKILRTDIYKFSIPMRPFTIATGTMHFAQNIFIRVHVEDGFYGVGECSAFPMIVGETQETCFAMAKDFAQLWKGRDALPIQERMDDLDRFARFNPTAKSAFEMALFDIAAKQAGQPLYRFLGGRKIKMETDLTIGIDTPGRMAEQALQYKKGGVRIIKIKLGKDGQDDIERVKQIRQAVGKKMILRVDANQGWDYQTAKKVLTSISECGIQFCEQPMRWQDDERLPRLKAKSPVKIMADESVFDHRDAMRLLDADACDYVNIKLAKSGGILEAAKINEVCRHQKIPCMMGGMLESRVALTAFAHFAMAHTNIIFYDMDTCLLGHLVDPVTGGVQYDRFFLLIPDAPGIGADVNDEFLNNLESVSI